MQIESIRVSVGFSASKRLEWKDRNIKQLEIHSGQKSKKFYFDFMSDSPKNNTHTHVPSGFESLGLICGSLGGGLSASDHVKNYLNGEELEVAMFGFTDTKLVDLMNDGKAVRVQGFDYSNHLNLVNQDELLARLNSSSHMPTACIIIIKSMPFIKKISLIDLKSFGFASAEDDLISSSIEKLNRIISILSIPGSEGVLNFEFPLGVFCKDILGGNSHCTVNYWIDSNNPNIQDQEIWSVLEFLASLRKVRNRIYQYQSYDNINTLSITKNAETSNNSTEDNQKLIDKIQVMENSFKDLQNELLSSELVYKSTIDEILLVNQEQAMKILELSNNYPNKAISIKSFNNQSKQNYLKLERENGFLKKQSEIDIQFLKLQLLETKTALAESLELKRIVETKNVLLEFEKEEAKSALKKIEEQHQIQIDRMVTQADEIGILSNQKLESEGKLKLSINSLGIVKSELQASNLKIKDLMKQVCELQEKTMAQNAKIDQAQAGLEFQARNDILLKENNSLKQKFEEIESKLKDQENLGSDFALLVAKTKVLEAKILEKQEEIQEINKKTEGNTKTRNELQVENSSLKNQVKLLEENIQDLNTRLALSMEILQKHISKEKFVEISNNLQSEDVPKKSKKTLPKPKPHEKKSKEGPTTKKRKGEEEHQFQELSEMEEEENEIQLKKVKRKKNEPLQKSYSSKDVRRSSNRLKETLSSNTSSPMKENEVLKKDKKSEDLSTNIKGGILSSLWKRQKNDIENENSESVILPRIPKQYLETKQEVEKS